MDREIVTISDNSKMTVDHYIWFNSTNIFLQTKKTYDFHKSKIEEYAQRINGVEIDILGSTTILSAAVSEKEPKEHRVVQQIIGRAPRLPGFRIHANHQVCDEMLEKCAEIAEDWRVKPQEYLSLCTELSLYSFQDHLKRDLILYHIGAPGCPSADHLITRSEAGYNFTADLPKMRLFEEVENWFSENNKCIDVSFEEIESWISEFRVWHGQKSESPIDRAICAFAHITNSESVPEILFWLFFGLEAIYSPESHSVRSNLMDRFPLLLDSIERKDVSNLFRLRSSLFHGNKNLNMPFDDSEQKFLMESQMEKEMRKIFRIFLFTIFELIRKKSTKIEFSTSVSFE